jgi:membrane protease YdiL (CAAX protease family)
MGLGVVFVGLSAQGQPRAFVLLLYAAGFLLTTLGLLAGAGSQALQRQADAYERYRGPSPFLLFVASFAMSNLAIVVLSAVGIGEDTLLGPLGALVGAVITGGTFLVLIQLLVVNTGALAWAEMGFVRGSVDGRGTPPTGTVRGDLATGLVLALPVLFGTALIAQVLVRLLGVEPTSVLPEPESTLGVVLNLVTAVVVAPVTEEVFFRGFATTAWARSIGPARAITRGALFFALVHILSIGGPSFDVAIRTVAIAFIARLPVAYALEVLFVRRGSIWASIALHAGFNGSILLLAYGVGSASGQGFGQ